jgi:hypothetical protein
LILRNKTGKAVLFKHPKMKNYGAMKCVLKLRGCKFINFGKP